MACFQSTLTFNIYVYLKRSVFKKTLCKHISERKDFQERMVQVFKAAGSAKLLQFVEGADRCPGFHNSFVVSACSAVTGTAPLRRAGYVKELPGIGGV